MYARCDVQPLPVRQVQRLTGEGVPAFVALILIRFDRFRRPVCRDLSASLHVTSFAGERRSALGAPRATCAPAPLPPPWGAPALTRHSHLPVQQTDPWRAFARASYNRDITLPGAP